MLTKLDILDTIEEIKLGVSYKLDGKVLESMPGECVCVVCSSKYSGRKIRFLNL